jgi:hypothetical protein
MENYSAAMQIAWPANCGAYGDIRKLIRREHALARRGTAVS